MSMNYLISISCVHKYCDFCRCCSFVLKEYCDDDDFDKDDDGFGLYVMIMTRMMRMIF